MICYAVCWCRARGLRPCASRGGLPPAPAPLEPARRERFFLGGSHWRPPNPPSLVFFMVGGLPRWSGGRVWAKFSPLFYLRIGIFHRRLVAFCLQIVGLFLAFVKYYSYLCTI